MVASHFRTGTGPGAVAVEVALPVDLCLLAVPLGVRILGTTIFFPSTELLDGISAPLRLLLQDRILHYLLADEFAEFDVVQLQELDRLLQLGGHHQLLLELQLELQLERHLRNLIQFKKIL